LLNADEQDELFSLNLFHVSNRLNIYHQEVLYSIAEFGIYHVENILKLCKINYINIVTKSIKHILCKVSDYIKRFLRQKCISENAIGSYGIVKMLYIPSTFTIR